MIDWRNQERIDRFVFEMVDPDLTTSRGELNGVIRNGSSLCMAYYTETRVSGSLKIVDSNYIENSLIRIHHYIDEWNYHTVLGTFFTDTGELDYEHGVWSGTMPLRSTLWGLKEEAWCWNYIVSAGSYTKDRLADIFRITKRPYEILSSVRNVKYSTSVAFLAGENILSKVFEICDKCNARLDVDGYGKVFVKPDVQPSNLTPVFEYDYDSSDAMIVGAVSFSDGRTEAPGRVGVIFKDGDTEITAYSDAPATAHSSSANRGYTKTLVHSLTDMSPQTRTQAQQLANTYLANALNTSDEFSFKSLYVPLNQGDAVSFVIEGKSYKCLVKTVEPSLDKGMPMDIRLKVA
jgi:hypothetical protein